MAMLMVTASAHTGAAPLLPRDEHGNSPKGRLLPQLLAKSLPSSFVCLSREHLRGNFILRGHSWMVPPPNTHLLLFGTSHFYSMSSVLRVGFAHLGVLNRTDIVGHSGMCERSTDAVPDWRNPASSLSSTDFLAGRCNTRECIQVCGLGQSACENQQGIVVDYLTENRTITTIVNHAQSQRSDGGAYLDTLLSKLPWNLTHSAFIRPHEDAYFDAQCEKEQTGTLPDANKVGDKVEPCGAYADAACPGNHSAYGVLKRHAPRIATVLLPDLGAPPSLAGSDRLGLRCVTDEQIASPECGGQRNTTAWTTQAFELYTDSNDPESHNLSRALRSDSHLCDVICHTDHPRLVTRRQQTNVVTGCREGPGLAAVWLVLRAAGLAWSREEDVWDRRLLWRASATPAQPDAALRHAMQGRDLKALVAAIHENSDKASLQVLSEARALRAELRNGS